jgi:hypothetical protein
MPDDSSGGKRPLQEAAPRETQRARRRSVDVSIRMLSHGVLPLIVSFGR